VVPVSVDPLDMSGRVVLVTGGSRGVGRGIAETFLAHGAEVVVCGRTEPAELPRAGPRQALFVAGDVRDPDQVDALVTTVVARCGRIDVAVNNAGGAPPADPATASPRFSTAIITLNLLAPLFVAQRANAVMQTQAEGGSILNIASINGMRPAGGMAAYGAAKAGLINLTQSFAEAYAPKVRVNCVTAGIVETETLTDVWYANDAARLAGLAAAVPMGRLGRPADVGNACLFLSSALAGHISGANLVVHGGGEPPDSILAGA